MPNATAGAVFFTGAGPVCRPSRIANDTPLPRNVSVSEIVNNPSAFADARVTIDGCYVVDPYHGASLSDGERAIEMFGGSDDIGDTPFDWTRQKVCGRFVGTVEFRPQDVPLKYLCPNVCFDSEGTYQSVIVNDPR